MTKLIDIDEAGIDAAVNRCHAAAVQAGWWNNPATGQPYDAETTTYLIGTRIALVHSEVSEALEGFRKGKMDDHLPHRRSVEVELADAMIRIFDLAGKLGLDLGGAYAEKLAYNRARADHRPENRVKDGGKAF